MRLRRSSRSPAKAALSLVGTATLASVPPAAAGDTALAIYWLLAAPGVLLATWLLIGLGRESLLVLLASATPFLASALGQPIAAADLAMGAALVAVGAILPSRLIAAAGVTLAVAQATLITLDAEREAALVAVTTGALLLGTALVARGPRRPLGPGSKRTPPGIDSSQ